MSRGMIAGAVVAAVALLVALPLILPKEAPTPSPPPEPAMAPAAPAPAPAPEALVTRAEYDALRLGVTYNDVVEIIGEYETESEYTYDDGKSGYTSPTATVLRTWKNADESYAKLGFISNKLVQKEQDGLR